MSRPATSSPDTRKTTPRLTPAPARRPKPCIAKTVATSLPRLRTFEYSLMIVALSGQSPPTPTPRRNRQRISTSTVVSPPIGALNALPTEPIAITVRVTACTRRRPSRSPSHPNAS